ncbi:unnamed protein product [Mesocestoides corti]|uniref:Ciliary neurotrophic factor n=1 Tax=Mesocestoides corti TaxID=53468 RepID=A0A0R3UQI7_MESCO|nr:unnamed protein product [Mesocestoides corti]
MTLDVVRDGLEKQFQVILSTQVKWQGTVIKSGEIFTSLAYNLVRELRLSEAEKPSQTLRSFKLVPESAPASTLFLAGDADEAAHLASAERIEGDFDCLEGHLRQLCDHVKSVEKAIHRLTALRNLGCRSSSLPSPRGDSGDGAEHFPIELLSWQALLSECQALLNRLRADLAFRGGLLRCLARYVFTCSTRGDFGAPQRLCFLWRQADQVVKWENVTGLVEEILS